MDFWESLAAYLPVLAAFGYEIFTGTLRPQFEIFSNIALWVGKLIQVNPTIDEYYGDRNLNVKVENRPFLVIFRRPLSCRAQMELRPLRNGVPQEGGRFDVAFLGKEKQEKVDLDVGIENTVCLITSSPVKLPTGTTRVCRVPPNGSHLHDGDCEIRLILSWGVGSRSYLVGKYRLPDLVRL